MTSSSSNGTKSKTHDAHRGLPSVFPRLSPRFLRTKLIWSPFLPQITSFLAVWLSLFFSVNVIGIGFRKIQYVVTISEVDLFLQNKFYL